MPVITKRDRTAISPWVTLTERTIDDGTGALQKFHSIAIHDYITVLAVTRDRRVPLVRQFRPALERVSLELPGGLLDDTTEGAARAVTRELYEETGCRVTGEPRLLGRLDPDSGRLENQLWAFYAADVEVDTAWRAEPGIECVFAPVSELLDQIRDGRFVHAPHIAIIGLAILNGLL